MITKKPCLVKAAQQSECCFIITALLFCWYGWIQDLLRSGGEAQGGMGWNVAGVPKLVQDIRELGREQVHEDGGLPPADIAAAVTGWVGRWEETEPFPICSSWGIRLGWTCGSSMQYPPSSTRSMLSSPFPAVLPSGWEQVLKGITCTLLPLSPVEPKSCSPSARGRTRSGVVLQLPSCLHQRGQQRWCVDFSFQGLLPASGGYLWEEGRAGSSSWKEKPLPSLAPCIAAACGWSKTKVVLGLYPLSDQPGTAAAMVEKGVCTTAPAWFCPCFLAMSITHRSPLHVISKTRGIQKSLFQIPEEHAASTVSCLE